MEPLGDILSRFLDSSGLARRHKATEMQVAWRAAMGELAEHTRLDAVRKNVAHVVVDNASLMAELNNFRKLELLDHLQREVHSVFIRDIKFRLGQVNAPGGGPSGT